MLVICLSVKESGYVSKCNLTGELSLESIKMIFSPVHRSSPPVQSTSPVHQSSPVIVDYQGKVGYGPTNMAIFVLCHNPYGQLKTGL